MKQDHSGIIKLLEMANENPEDCGLSVITAMSDSDIPDVVEPEWHSSKTILFKIKELSLQTLITVNYYKANSIGDGKPFIYPKNIGKYKIAPDLIVIGDNNTITVKGKNASFLEVGAGKDISYTDEGIILDSCKELLYKNNYLKEPSDSMRASMLVKSKLKNISHVRERDKY